ncbi:CRAL-TRIO domain-containing protein [Aspergillus alliaceus]|uniref:CRAL-TRIO domain-containing protein n=1 Tax=Petromyces alliaceus TaxID=209559 RepID=A0A5N7CBQ8_PETAA|nr:CRAL-TRIO domain-containing protein [Aspergillus alliaceus]
MVLFWRNPEAHNSLVDENSAFGMPKNSSRQDTEAKWMAGQLNHLTQEQDSKLLRFRNLCEQHGYCKAQTNDEWTDNDRAILLRFLRAQRFEIDNALEQFRDAYEWKAEHGIKSFYQNMDVEMYEFSRQMFSQWTGHRDSRGLPIYVFPLKHLTKERMEAFVSKMSSFSVTPSSSSSQTPGHLIVFHALYENMLDFVMPLCNQLERPHMEIPVTASTHIIDLSGVTLRQFFDLKRYLQGATLLATKHYPETLSRIFILGAPPLFRTAWQIIKNWVDPGTLSKISVLSPSESRRELLAYIEPSSLPEQYGGTLNWKWGDMPNLDDHGRSLAPSLYQGDASGSDYFIKGPVIFKDGAIEGLGSAEGKIRKIVIPVHKPRVIG